MPATFRRRGEFSPTSALNRLLHEAGVTVLRGAFKQGALDGALCECSRRLAAVREALDAHSEDPCGERPDNFAFAEVCGRGRGRLDLSFATEHMLPTDEDAAWREVVRDALGDGAKAQKPHGVTTTFAHHACVVAVLPLSCLFLVSDKAQLESPRKRRLSFESAPAGDRVGHRGVCAGHAGAAVARGRRAPVPGDRVVRPAVPRSDRVRAAVRRPPRARPDRVSARRRRPVYDLEFYVRCLRLVETGVEAL